MTVTIDGINVKDFFMQMKDRNVNDSYEQLSNAHVTIAGSGGLGSNIAIALARSGVGHLTLIDFDDVELSNLNRQQFKFSQIGVAKVVALKQNLLEFNPFIKVNTIKERVTPENISTLFKDCDIICEAFDNPSAKAMLLDGATKHFADKPLVMGNGLAGIHESNQIQTVQRYPNVYISGDGQTSGSEGLMAPRVIICAGHQANAILRLIMQLPVVQKPQED